MRTAPDAAMTMPDDAGQHSWIAILMVAILGALGTAWKSWFGVRQDRRTDRKGEVVNGTYESVIKTLREQLAQEREWRQKAEAEVALLRRQLLSGGRAPDWEDGT